MSVWLVGWFVTGEVFVSNDLTFGLVSQYADSFWHQRVCRLHIRVSVSVLLLASMSMAGYF